MLLKTGALMLRRCNLVALCACCEIKPTLSIIRAYISIETKQGDLRFLRNYLVVPLLELRCVVQCGLIQKLVKHHKALARETPSDVRPR